MPPGARSTESVIDRFRAGVERMVHARTTFGPKGTEIHCPASKSSSGGSTMRTSTSITSGRGQRMAVTSARHSLGFCANYKPSPRPSPWKGEGVGNPRPRRGRGQGEGEKAEGEKAEGELTYTLLNLGTKSAANRSSCSAS